MRQLKEMLLTILILTPVVFGAEYSKAQLLTYAYENSEELAEIEQEQLRAQNMRKEYNASAFPQIDGAFNYQFKPKSYNPYSMDMGNIPAISGYMDANAEGYTNDSILAATIDGLTGGLGSFDLSPKKHTLQWEITAMQPIFAQGKVKTGVEIAELYNSTLESQYLSKKFSIAEQVLQTYNVVLLSQEVITIQEEALAVAKQSHDIAIKRFLAGKGTQLDTLNTRYTVQNEEFKLRDAKKNRLLGIKLLTTVISMEVDPTEVTLSDTFEIHELPYDMDQALQKVKENNATLEIFDKTIQFQGKQEKLAKADYLPSVAAGAGLGQITQFNDADEIDFGWDIKLFAGVQMPIWHGGQRKYRLKQAEIETRKVEYKKEAVTNQLHLGLLSAYEQYNLAKEDLLQVEELLALTTKGAKIAELSYEIGQITQLELNQTKQNVNKTKLAHAKAIYDLNNAIISIEKLVGNTTLLNGK